MARSRFLLRAAVSLSSAVFSSVFVGIGRVPSSYGDSGISPSRKAKGRALAAPGLQQSAKQPLRNGDLARLHLLCFWQRQGDHTVLDSCRNLAGVDRRIQLESAAVIMRTRLAMNGRASDLRQRTPSKDRQLVVFH